MFLVGEESGRVEEACSTAVESVSQPQCVTQLERDRKLAFPIHCRIMVSGPYLSKHIHCQIADLLSDIGS